MDIVLLRQILKECNPIFWNKKIDRILQESNYPNRTPIESARWRYVVALRDLHPNLDAACYLRSAPYRKTIDYDRNPEKRRRDKLFEEARQCLAPWDKVYEALRRAFTSSFAEQVLLTHEDLIRNFVGTADEHVPWSRKARWRHGRYSTAAIAERRRKRAEGQMVSALVDSLLRSSGIPRFRSLDVIESLISRMTTTQLLHVGRRLQIGLTALETRSKSNK